jgi:hypothetical protein
MVELSKVTRIDEENVDPSSPAKTRRPDRIGSIGRGVDRRGVETDATDAILLEVVGEVCGLRQRPLLYSSRA